MPKKKDQKRYEAILRELKYWDNYDRMPDNVKTIVRSTFRNLSVGFQNMIEEEVGKLVASGYRLLFR